MSTVAKIRRQFVDLLRYLWVAALATVLNLGFAAFLREKFDFSLFASATAGYTIGIFLGFTLSRAFSFKDRTSTSARSESVKYLFVTFCAYLVTIGATLVIYELISSFFEAAPSIRQTAVSLSQATGRHWLNRDLIANMGGIGVGFFVNFFGHKFLTFRKTNTLDRFRRKVS